MKETTLGLVTAMVTALVTLAPLSAQDQRWLQMWENAQKLRPARVGSVERIAPAGQAGIPFVLHGTIVDPSGKPAQAVEVFAYQTDTHGIYAAQGAADPWPLKGWAITDAEGRFEFRTIRPAAYPSNTVPGHVHLTFKTACCGRQVTEVMFDDDPLATPEFRQRSAGDAMFGKVVKHGDGSQETSYRFTLKARGNF
jgi:protocatechuate 3,4-dioxygenase beta subunit